VSQLGSLLCAVLCVRGDLLASAPLRAALPMQEDCRTLFFYRHSVHNQPCESLVVLAAYRSDTCIMGMSLWLFAACAIDSVCIAYLVGGGIVCLAALTRCR
jgi:hypothetical protein